LTRRPDAIRVLPPRPCAHVDGGFISHNHTPERRFMGRRSLPGNAALKTAEMPGLLTLSPAWGVLVACVWIAFLPALSNGFVDWDDPQWIVENHSFRGLGPEQIQFAFSTLKGGVYQPLGWLVQSLTYQFYGLDPRGYHLVSLLFHVANVVLLHLLCVRLVTRRMPEVVARLGVSFAWLCGIPVLLYAVHPLRVEMVAWASPQAYLPSITLSLLATLAYLQAHPPSGNFRRLWMTGSSILVVLAVLTKGSAVVLPFVFLILDAYPLGRLGSGQLSWPAVRKVLFEKIPVLIFCVALTVVAFVAKDRWLDPEVKSEPVLFGRVAQAGFGTCFYLLKTAWPFGISPYYPRPEGENFRTPLFGACFAVVMLLVAAAIRLRRKWPWLMAALAAYILIASPYLGLVRVSVTLASDRYCHAAMMVWVVIGCGGLCILARRRWSGPVRLGAFSGTVVIAGFLMALCSAQCRVWGSNEHLWSHALNHARWSPELHHYMGTTLAEEGKLELAHAELSEALRLRPHFPEATYDMGVLLDRRGETEAAIAYLREAKRLKPSDAMVAVSLGGILVQQGHVDEAVALYREALRYQPDFPNLHFNLGVALLLEKKVDQAISELTRAVELRPWYTEAYAALGGAFVLQGRQGEAAVQYRNALRLDPDHSASRINLGLALAGQRRFAEAIAQLREAIRRDRRNPDAHHVLGAVLVSLGRIKEGSAEYEEVLRLRPDHAQARAFLATARRRRM
jgi:Tfp pilus assembly protein PilF